MTTNKQRNKNCPMCPYCNQYSHTQYNAQQIDMTTNQQNKEENKTCCCISYERGITPCLCGCHSTRQSAAKEAREEVLSEVIEIINSLIKQNTTCKSGECKHPSYPICRHAMGWNDALEENLLPKLQQLTTK